MMKRIIGIVLALVSALSALFAVQSYFAMSEAKMQNASVNFGGIAVLFFAVTALLSGVPAISLIRQKRRNEKETNNTSESAFFDASKK